MEIAGFLKDGLSPKLPKRSLIHDEIERFPCGHRFRVRVWAGVGATPLVLLSQQPNGPHPRASATEMANWVNVAILRYPAHGFIYFEDGVVLQTPYLSRVDLSYFGHSLRLQLYKPEVRPVEWDYLESIIGGKIER
jgi:hypothetical protein